jgi:hypothetical protein
MHTLLIIIIIIIVERKTEKREQDKFFKKGKMSYEFFESEWMQNYFFFHSYLFFDKKRFLTEKMKIILKVGRCIRDLRRQIF